MQRTNREERDVARREGAESGGVAQGDGRDEGAAGMHVMMQAVLRADPDELLDPLDLAFSPWPTDRDDRV